MYKTQINLKISPKVYLVSFRKMFLFFKKVFFSKKLAHLYLLCFVVQTCLREATQQTVLRILLNGKFQRNTSNFAMISE